MPNDLHGFHYQSPVDGGALSPMAHLVYVIGMLASGTTQVTRTLSNHPDGRAENVAEHSHMLSLIGIALAEEHFPALDSGLVAKYATIHDMAEVYVGDTPAYDLSPGELKAKTEREAKGIKQLAHEYNDVAPSLIKLIHTYESQSDPESRFVRMLDKLLTVCTQFPNKGVVVRNFNGDRAAHEHMIGAQIERHLKQYPDQKVILDLYAELAVFLRDITWPETVNLKS